MFRQILLIIQHHWMQIYTVQPHKPIPNPNNLSIKHPNLMIYFQLRFLKKINSMELFKMLRTHIMVNSNNNWDHITTNQFNLLILILLKLVKFLILATPVILVLINTHPFNQVIILLFKRLTILVSPQYNQVLTLSFKNTIHLLKMMTTFCYQHYQKRKKKMNFSYSNPNRQKKSLPLWNKSCNQLIIQELIV